LSRGVLDLIGNTPIIKLHNVVPDGAAEVWLKFEAGNPTGSYKDRMAMSVLNNAMKRRGVFVGVIDDASWFKPQAYVYTSKKLPHTPVDPEVETFDEMRS